MKYLGLILLIGFVALTVFGIFGMHADMQNHNGDCIAAAAQGTDCPKQSRLLDYFSFHLEAFKDFSTATFGENLSASLLTLVLLVAAIGLGIFHDKLVSPKFCLPYSRYRHWEFFSSPPKRQLASWLALHENSPAIF